jgi:translation initiation factor 3 subunit F
MDTEALTIPSLSNHSLSVNPTVFFAILDHFLRRPDGAAKVVGSLLGVRSEDGLEIEARNSFAVPLESKVRLF